MIGQQHAMTGQISAVWNIFLSVPTVGALLIGGTLSGMLGIGGGVLAEQGPGERERRGALADPGRTVEQVGVSETPGSDHAAQEGGGLGLSQQVCELHDRHAWSVQDAA